MLTKKDYESAIQVQDACNLSGVVSSFSEVLPRIWDEVRSNGKGTTEVNQHPISKLYADKIVDLARVRDFDSFSVAYKECRRRAE
uniref:Uncharacterized protein n=1 Tax=viral metagenome TaxID=1070528 RepID=A0A6M3LZC1_9ZZZZ